MKTVPIVAALVLVSIPFHGLAQRQRPQQAPQELRCPPQSTAMPVSPDPYVTLERELPSLRVDLGLTSQQQQAWRSFERNVRVLAELERQRLRQMLPMRDKAREPPAATALVAMLAELDRRKAEATQALNVNLGELYAALDDQQKRMLDRRVLLSQADPLTFGRTEKPE